MTMKYRQIALRLIDILQLGVECMRQQAISELEELALSVEKMNQTTPSLAGLMLTSMHY